MSSKGKRALVIGASRGVGRAVALALVADGARVCAVARSRENLDQLAKEAAGELLALAGDASDREFLAKAFTDADPDIVVSTLGVSPKLGTIEEQDWDSFSAAWNTDVKHAFHLSQLALSRPLRPGSIVVTFSSGAAIGGSPLSGGYAGAKRMQWFLAGYAAAVSKQKGLNIRFLALLPKQ
ncbi:MAG TPA: SDR family oxidoreductase, partial [Polyangiaceae bacterium]|nr:SDR family oxidoreductase [Polyangiaceae bacterium]